MDTKQIIERIKANPDGITLDFNGNKINPKNGYAVSLTNHVIPLNKINASFLKRLRHDSRLIKGALLGGWRDKNGNQYLDITVLVSDIREAFTIGRKHKQQAIFSFADMKEIYLS